MILTRVRQDDIPDSGAITLRLGDRIVVRRNRSSILGFTSKTGYVVGNAENTICLVPYLEPNLEGRSWFRNLFSIQAWINLGWGDSIRYNNIRSYEILERLTDRRID